MPNEIIITLVAVVTPLLLVVGGKWIAWSVTNAIDEKLDAKIDPLARKLEQHMSDEAQSTAVNNEQHTDFRHRLESQEHRLTLLEGQSQDRRLDTLESQGQTRSERLDQLEDR